MAQARILLWNESVGSQIITLTAPHRVIAGQIVSWLSDMYDIPATHIQLSRNENVWFQGAEYYSRIIVNVNDQIHAEDSLHWKVLDII